MKKHIIVTIRYSLLSENLKTAWKIGGHSFNDYKRILFDQERLRIKQTIFKNITLRSLIKIEFQLPVDTALKVHILTSEDLPSENMSFLEKISKEYSFIEIKKQSPSNTSLYVDFEDYLKNNVRDGESYVSVRLDDDDALSINWLHDILHYARNPLYFNHVVSLCGGYAINISNDSSVKKMVEWKWRFASAGMAYIGKKNDSKNLNIYSCGSHSITDNRYVTILDARRKHFVRSYNEFNDSGVDFPGGAIIPDEKFKKLLSREFGISLGNANDYLYDYHNNLIDFNGVEFIKDSNESDLEAGLIVREKLGKFYFYVESFGFLNVDDHGKFVIENDCDKLNYEIFFTNPAKFYVRRNDGYYLSSLSGINKGVCWQPHLSAWEYFFRLSKL